MTLASTVNLNATTPAPATGRQNVVFSDDSGSPTVNVSAIDPVMVGDSGSGGTAGNVPKPGAGDAAAGKFLKADGTWAVPSGGGGAAALPPYLQIGSTLYIPADNMSEATLPPSSPTWLNSVAPSSTVVGPNGNVTVRTGASLTAWASSTAAASVEAVLSLFADLGLATGNYPTGGVWIYDSTNGMIYAFNISYTSTTTTTILIVLQVQIYTYSGSGNPAFSSTVEQVFHGTWGLGSPIHLRLVKSGSTLSFEYSTDGGQTFTTVTTESVGTLSEGGYYISGPNSTTTVLNVMSLAVS